MHFFMHFPVVAAKKAQRQHKKTAEIREVRKMALVSGLQT